MIGVTGAWNALELYDDLDLDAEANIRFWGPNNELAWFQKATEEMTIAVGHGAAGEWGPTFALMPADSAILAVVTRITQAPGGGATMISIGRWPGDWEEFLEEGTVGLGDTSNSAADGSGSLAGPVYNADADVLLYTTDVDVTISDMKIRVTSYYIDLLPPES